MESNVRDYYVMHEHEKRPSKLDFFDKHMKTRFENSKNLIALDVGCGSGIEVALLCEMGFKSIGAELHAEFLRKAAGKYLGKSGCYFVRCDAKKLPFRSRSFTLVTAFDVLEHVEHPEKLLQEIKRVLRKDGNLLLIIPNKWSLQEVLNWINTKIAHLEEGLGHVNYWNYFTIKKFLNESGFKTLNLDYHYGPLLGNFNQFLDIVIRIPLKYVIIRDDKKLYEFMSHVKLTPFWLRAVLAKLDDKLKNTLFSKFFIYFIITCVRK